MSSAMPSVKALSTTETPDNDGPRSKDSYDEQLEFCSDYRPGKLHPVHFGDLFSRSKYKIIRKLGAGSFSTVWLARDRKKSAYVALKITRANSNSTENESRIYRYLSRERTQHPGQQNVITLLDSFEHQGPNGLHQCLVFDAMGPSITTMLLNISSNLKSPSSVPLEIIQEEGRNRFALWVSKSILRQTLLGLDFLHRNDIVHSDLQPGNSLFSIKTSRRLAKTSWDRIGRNLDTIDLRMWDTTYKMVWPMLDHVDLGPPLLVKIADLGGAFFVSDPPAKPVTPLALRSPELILGDPITQAQDIWSFGCLIYELVTGSMLFAVLPDIPDVESTMSHRDNEAIGPTTDDDTNDEHILQMADILGPLPASFLARYPRSHLYFNEKGEKIKDYIGELPEDLAPNEITPLLALEASVDKNKGTDLSENEASVTKQLLRAILQFDPVKRPSASELLTHPWFANPATKAE